MKVEINVSEEEIYDSIKGKIKRDTRNIIREVVEQEVRNIVHERYNDQLLREAVKNEVESNIYWCVRNTRCMDDFYIKLGIKGPYEDDLKKAFWSGAKAAWILQEDGFKVSDELKDELIDRIAENMVEKLQRSKKQLKELYDKYFIDTNSINEKSKDEISDQDEPAFTKHRK